MNEEKALAVLQDHNQWRRSKGEYSGYGETAGDPFKQPKYSAKEVGEAIDVAINTLEGLKPKKKHATIYHAIIHHADGSHEIIENPTFDKIKEAIGGHIEIVAATPDGTSVVLADEEGRLKNLPRNKTYPELYGPVVVTPTEILD